MIKRLFAGGLLTALTALTVTAQTVCPALDVDQLAALATCGDLEPGQVCTPDGESALIREVLAANAAPALIRVSDGVTLVLIGEAALSLAETDQPRPVIVAAANTSGTAINLRSGPGTTFSVAGTMAAGETADVDGISADGAWLRRADGAWVFASLVTVEGETDSLSIVDADTPLTAETVETTFTLEASSCAESGVLVGLNAGGEVTLNWITIRAEAEAQAFAQADGAALTLVATSGDLTAIVDGADALLSAGDALTVTTDGVERGSFEIDALALPPEGLALLQGSAQAVDSESPEGVVYQYLEARTRASAADMQALSCSAWDTQAVTQSQSFRAMNATLQDVSCSVSAAESSGDQAVVVCEGVIRTAYSGQTRDWPIKDYALVQEDGVWRICGEAN
ncbi:MAG: hypothetical protein SF162_14220 [bacterium]|nr:hypothetical protein [bacterium]